MGGRVIARRDCARCSRQLSKKRARLKYCYLCEVAVRREQSDKAHDNRVCSTYGLKPGEYRKLFEAQGGRCAIWNCQARGVARRLSVDHDHKIGLNRRAIRGLLCKKHNRMLGDVGDDPLVLLSMAEYLTHPPAQEVLNGTQG